MRSIKPDGVGPMVRAQAIGLPGRACLSVSAMWQLDNGVLCGDGEMWKTIAAEGGGVFDMGLPKPRAEVLAEAVAHVAEPTIGVQVRLQLGKVDKRLYVIGDREWKMGGASDPVPFREMRVSWDNAFGDPDDPRNSLGKGFKPITGEDGTTRHLLPNIELPKKLIRSPNDRPAPAGYGPLDLLWQPRCQRRGTYDARWYETRFPELPKDFDPLFHNVAPEDQWLQGFVRGDEAFVIENMHPQQPVLQGKLPGLTARGFVRLRERDDAIDVPMHCDTVWFFPHVARVALVWRGVFSVPSDDPTEVTEAMVALERLGEPRPLSYYEEIRRLRLDKDRGALHALRDADLLPEGVKVAKPQADLDLEPALDREWAMHDMLRRRAEQELEKSRQRIAAVGFQPDDVLPKELPPDEEWDTEDLAALMDKLDAKVAEVTKEAEARKAEAMEDLKKACEDAGLDFEKMLEDKRRESLGPPKYSAEKELETLRSFAGLAQKTHIEVPPEVRAQLDDPYIDDKFRHIEKTLRDGYRMGAHYQDPVPPLPGDKAQQLRVQVQAAMTAGMSLAGRDLTGADLSGMDFSGQDLSGVLAESAKLDGCRFDGARFERAVLAHASIREASFKEAQLNGTNLGRADLSGSSFEGADMTQTVLLGANLSGASLARTRLDGADLTDANLDGASLRSCRAKELTFTRVRFGDADVRDVDLTMCNFLEVDCRKADFSGARLVKSAFLDSCGDGARFRGAKLENLRVVKAETGCSFEKADFRESDLSQAFMRGVKLAGSDFRGSTARAADFSEADLRGAKLGATVAVDARFERADLSGADFEAVDLMNALLTRAKIAGTSFRRANLFRADGMGMIGDDRTSFEGANLKRFRFKEHKDQA